MRVERIGRAFEGVTSQSRHVPQQNNFSTQNNFSQNDFSQNNFFDAEHLSHRRLARTMVTNLESLLLRLAEKSSHVHITERVLYTEVQRKVFVAYHRDPAAIGFDLPQRQTVTGCRRAQLTLHSVNTHHSHISLEFLNTHSD